MVISDGSWAGMIGVIISGEMHTCFLTDPNEDTYIRLW